MNLSLRQYIDGVGNGDFSPQEVVQHYLWKAKNDSFHAWLRLHEDYIGKNTDVFASRSLHAAPIGIKDNILTQWYEITCGSKILEGYIPPYSATCFEKLEEAGGLMLGKTNMDEFAMWSSTEHSAFGPTYNPVDSSRVPGWSSWGSAVAVADDQCLAALGTETWGSVRQPAALCGVVGMKPSYGRVSRYGVQAMASSINQVGVVTKTVVDSVLMLDTIAWYDIHDAQSIDREDEQKTWYDQLDRTDLSGMRLAVPKQFFSEWLDPKIYASCKDALWVLESMWAKVEEIDFPEISYTIPIYYVLVPAEISSELARFDGLRFWLQEGTTDYETIYQYYEAIRNIWFGDEVKRRIMVWSYVLSAGYYDAYYHKAQEVQQKLKNEFTKVYKDFDAIVWPTTPSLAWKLWEKVDDPIQMYLEDMYTAPANVTWLPAISVPIAPVEEDGVTLPVGLQIIGKMRDEWTIFGIAGQVEKKFKK